MGTVQVQLNGETKVVAKGSTVQEILGAWPGQSHPQIMAAIVGTDLRELSYRINEDTVVRPIDLTHVDGVRIYSRSLIMGDDSGGEGSFPWVSGPDHVFFE